MYVIRYEEAFSLGKPRKKGLHFALARLTSIVLVTAAYCIMPTLNWRCVVRLAALDTSTFSSLPLLVILKVSTQYDSYTV